MTCSRSCSPIAPAPRARTASRARPYPAMRRSRPTKTSRRWVGPLWKTRRSCPGALRKRPPCEADAWLARARRLHTIVFAAVVDHRQPPSFGRRPSWCSGARDRCLGHCEQLGDLDARVSAGAERRHRLDALLARAVVDPPPRGGAVEEAGGALGAVAGGLLLGGAHAHRGGRGRLVSVHPSSATRRASRRRWFRLRAAYRAAHPGSPWK